MIELTREVRCFGDSGPDAAHERPLLNAWAGGPATDCLAPFLVWRCTLRGPISPETDYLCNVKWIDQLVRGQLQRTGRNTPSVAPRRPIPTLAMMYAACRDEVAAAGPLTLARFELALSPYLRFAIEPPEESMVSVTHEYEFSASHRLHHLGFSEQQNRAVYGKCNNPHGHGHNYVVQVTWKLPIANEGDLALSACDAVVKREVIDRLDHRYLNAEVPPFDQLNPTVENIAVTVWNWLEHHFPEPMQLQQIRVYETPKTWADYRGAI